MAPACVYWLLVRLVSFIVITSSELPPATDCAFTSPHTFPTSRFTCEIESEKLVWLLTMSLSSVDPSAQAWLRGRIARAVEAIRIRRIAVIAWLLWDGGRAHGAGKLPIRTGIGVAGRNRGGRLTDRPAASPDAGHARVRPS